MRRESSFAGVEDVSDVVSAVREQKETSWIAGLIDWSHQSMGSASQMLLSLRLGCLTQFLSGTGFL